MHVVRLRAPHLRALERHEGLVGVDVISDLHEQLHDAPRHRGVQARGALLVEVDGAAQVGHARSLDLGHPRELEEGELGGGEPVRHDGRRRIGGVLGPPAAGQQGEPEREQAGEPAPHGAASNAAARVTSNAAVYPSSSASR